MRQAQFEAFGDIIGKVAPYAPDVTRALLDVLVDMSDMPLREIAVKRIRQVTGQRDENEKLSPEEQAQIDANQQRRNFPTGSRWKPRWRSFARSTPKPTAWMPAR